MAQTNPQPATNSNNTIWIYLGYLLESVFGFIGLLVVKDDENVRFHCAQSMVYWLIVFVVNMILSITIFLPFIIWAAALVYAIIVMLKAAKGERTKMPLIGDFCEKTVMNWFK